MVLQMIVLVGLVVGRDGADHAEGRPLHQGQAVVAGDGAGREGLRARRLLRNQPVLDDLVLVAARGRSPPRPGAPGSSPCSRMASRMAAMISPRFDRDMAAQVARRPRRAAATQASTVAKTPSRPAARAGSGRPAGRRRHPGGPSVAAPAVRRRRRAAPRARARCCRPAGRSAAVITVRRHPSGTVSAPPMSQLSTMAMTTASTGLLVGDRGLPRRRARGVEHVLALAGADRVDGHHASPPVSLPSGPAGAQHQELQALEALLLAAWRPRGRAPLPGSWPAYASAWRPSGITASTLACGRAITCTATTSPTRVAAVWPASQAALTAATSPRTMAVV